jgi:hypothetical protein
MIFFFDFFLSSFLPFLASHMVMPSRYQSARSLTFFILFILTFSLVSAKERKPFKVFGIGLGKSGTSTIGPALKLMGYENVHYDFRMSPFLLDDPRAFDFSHLYEDFDSTEDPPVALYYEEMRRVYPTARFILTVRDAEDWYQDFFAHRFDILRSAEGFLPFWTAMVSQLAYGAAHPEGNKETWIAHFNAHNERVPQVIPAAQLLVIDIFKTNSSGFWRSLCSFLDETLGPCASPDSTPIPPPITSVEQRKINTESLIAKRLRHEFPIVESPSISAYVSVITLDHSLLESLFDRPDIDDLTLLNSFIGTVKALRERGVKHDVILLIFGKQALRPSERAVLDQLRVYCYPVQEFKREKSHFRSPHEPFDMSLARFYRVNLNILRLTQYSKLFYFDARAQLSHGCDGLLDSMRGDLSVFRGDTQKAPFYTHAFLIRPSKQVYYDFQEMISSKYFSVEQGWYGAGSIPAWGPPTHTKHDWSFARSSQDIGLLYYYYFMSPVRKEGRVHASTIDPSAWAECVSLH